MKRIILCIISNTCMLSSSAHAQKLSPHITLHDGREVTDEHAFLTDDTCTFHVAGNGEKADWAFAYQTMWGGTVIKVRSKEASASFSIYADLIQDGIDNPTLWARNAKPFEEKGDFSIYYKGVVYTLDGDEKTDSMVIRFNLLPSRPRITGVSFTQDCYDWDNDTFYPNSTFGITFSAARCEDALLATESPHYTERPEKYDFFLHPEIRQESNGMLSVETSHTDWGEYYRLDVYNKYGIITGKDFFLTTDYITDPLILIRLKEISQESNAVQHVAAGNDIRIVCQGNRIEIQGDKSGVSSLTLYDGTGKVVKHQSHGEDMHLSGLPQGLYILSCRTKDHQTITTKIIRR